MTKKEILDIMVATSKNSMVENLGIEITDFGDKYVCGKMPVDNRTVQPYRLLHGGASVALAETLGSIAGGLEIDLNKQAIVGIEINANHLRSVRDGWVYGKATPLRIGKRIHVWKIDINDEEKNLICTSRITLAVIQKV